MNRKNDTKMGFSGHIFVTMIALMFLPTAAYIALTQMDTLSSYNFTHDNRHWVYWPQKDLVQEKGSSYANSAQHWLSFYQPGVETTLLLKAINGVFKIESHFLLGLHDFVQSKRNEIKKLSIAMLGMGLLLLLVNFLLSIGFKYTLLSLVSLQSSLACWFLSQPQILPIRDYWNMIPWESLWFRVTVATIGSAIFTLSAYTLYAVIFRNFIPVLTQKIKDLYKPRKEDNYKRSQLDVNDLRLRREDFNLTNLIDKYSRKGKYVIGVWNKPRSEKLCNSLKSKDNSVALIPSHNLDQHMLIVGGTGSGKTSIAIMGLVYQSIIFKKPIIIASWKHDPGFIKMVSALCQRLSVDFSLVTIKAGNQADPKGTSTWSSLSYNPLKNGDSRHVRDRLMTGLSLDIEGPASYYSVRAREALKGVLDLFARRSLTPSFHRLCRALSDDSLMQQILPRWDSKFSSDCAGLLAKLSDLSEFEVFNVAHSDVDLLKASRKPGVLYFDFDAMSYPHYGPALGRMFVADLLWSASSRFPEDPQMMIVLDEYQQAISSEFTQLVSQVRGAGMQLVLANQTLSQLATTAVGGRPFLDIIWANTAYKIFFRLLNPDDARMVAMASGSEAVKIYENTVEPGAASRSILASREMLGGRARVDYKPLIPENIWLNLPKSVVGGIFPNRLPGLISVDHIMSHSEYKAFANSAPPVMQGNTFDGSDPQMDALLSEFSGDAGGSELLG